MFRFILLFALLTLGLSQLKAQSYQTAAGLRLGYPTSLSVKHFISEPGAVEAHLGVRGYYWIRLVNLSAAYLHHSPLELDGVDNLSWYAGGGASLYIWSGDFGTSYTSFGLQGYLGLDYAFEDFPINLTLDWTPTFFLGLDDFNAFNAGYGALGVRYILR